MPISLKKNITRLLWNIAFIIYNVWNLLLLFITIAAFWKFLTQWSTYPQLFRWINLILPMLLIVIILLGSIGTFLKIVMCLLLRILIIIFAVLYWFALDPLSQIYTLFKSSIGEAWAEQMKGNPLEFNIVENFLHCCGINGTYDYVKINMTIPKSCEKYSNQNDNGCLLEAVEKFKLEQHDFFAWGIWLWIFITIDIILLSLFIYKISKQIRRDSQDIPLYAQLIRAEHIV